MKCCPKSKCLFSVVAVFIFVFGYDVLVHGNLLKEAYEQTASMWRPEADMEKFLPFCILYHFTLAVLISALFCMTSKKSGSCDSAPTEEKKCCPIKRGVCFGTIIGLLLGTLNAAAYIHIPIPASLAISWFFAGLFQGIGAGVVLAIINNKKSCSK